MPPTPEPGWGTAAWTLDPADVLAYAARTGAPGVAVLPTRSGIRVLDPGYGLVIDADPSRPGAWLVRAWVVARATARAAGPERDFDAFALAASVAVADRPASPDAALLVRRGDPSRPGAGWVAQGVHPGGLVLARLLRASRAAARRPGSPL